MNKLRVMLLALGICASTLVLPVAAASAECTLYTHVANHPYRLGGTYTYWHYGSHRSYSASCGFDHHADYIHNH